MRMGGWFDLHPVLIQAPIIIPVPSNPSRRNCATMSPVVGRWTIVALEFGIGRHFFGWLAGETLGTMVGFFPVTLRGGCSLLDSRLPGLVALQEYGY